MSNHPETVINSDWFDKSKYIANIPEPSFISVDRIDTISDKYPNIFIQVEPNIIINNENYLINNYTKYHTILTFNKTILEKCPNAKLYLYGSSWIDREFYENIDISKKQFQISNLAGSKVINNADGHLFRQQIHFNQDLLHDYPIVFFRSIVQQPYLPDFGNNPILDNKKMLFETFQFAIIIENSKQENYFTEKLGDCLITKTIPIYWGCPNISDFFNTDGWIILNTTSVRELQQKISVLSSDYYKKYINNIEGNYRRAIYYSDFYENLNN
jgi:hypothetical protein